MKIRWIGMRSYRQFFATERKELRVRLRKQTREAANVIAKSARGKAKAQFSGGDSRRSNYGGERRTGAGLLAKAIRAKVKVNRSYKVTAWVGVSNARRYFPASLYAPALEHGGTIEKRGRRTKNGDRGTPYSATYTARPFFDPAVRESTDKVYALSGQSFRVPR